MAQGFEVLGADERTIVGRNGRIETVYIISLETTRGATGTLEIPLREYEALNDEELAALLVEKAMSLDRPLTM